MTVIPIAHSGTNRSLTTHNIRWKPVLIAFFSLGLAASNFRIIPLVLRSTNTATHGHENLKGEIIQSEHDSKKQSNVLNLTQDASDSEIAESYKIPEFSYPRQCHFEKPLDGHGTTYDIALFYHVGMFNNWKNIMWDQLGALESCGLGYMASSLTISYSMASNSSSTNPGIDELIDLINQFTFAATLNISYVQASAVPWEQEAIAAVSQKCHESMKPDERTIDEGTKSEERKQVIVYYFHTKGVGHSSDENYQNTLYWRKHLEWFSLEKPTLCLRAILFHGAATCGVNFLGWPSWHYSGNFWFASCDWITTLPTTVQKSEDEFLNNIAAELWIGTNIPGDGMNSTKHVSLFTTGFGFYVDRFLPDQYNNINDHIKGMYSYIWTDYLATYGDLLESERQEEISETQREEPPQQEPLPRNPYLDEHQEPTTPLMHCSQYFTSDGYYGLNMLKQKFCGYLAEIFCADEGRIVLMPPIFSHGEALQEVYGKQRLLRFDQVFDLDVLNDFMSPIQLIPESLTPEPLLNEVEYEFVIQTDGIPMCRRRTKRNLHSNITCSNDVLGRKDGYSILYLLSIVGRERLLGTLAAIKASKNIRQVGEQFMTEHSNPDYVCVHMRTEIDFSRYMNDAGFVIYTNKDYKNKLERHMTDNPALYASINNVYIAGGHNENLFIKEIEPLFRDLFPNGSVWSHHSFNKNKIAEMEDIQKSGLDQEICARAKVFVGTDKSGWSEFTHYLRLALMTDAVKGGPAYADVLDFQVDSPNDQREGVTDELIKFRAAGHSKIWGDE